MQYAKQCLEVEEEGLARPGSHAFEWTNTEQGLRPWKVLVDHFSQMANPRVVFDSGMAAGKVLKTSMQDIIYSQPSLDDYADVAERIDVWGEVGTNVWVGVPETDPIMPRARAMDAVFPVIRTALDLERQTHEVEQVFETNLVSKVF